MQSKSTMEKQIAAFLRLFTSGFFVWILFSFFFCFFFTFLRFFAFHCLNMIQTSRFLRKYLIRITCVSPFFKKHINYWVKTQKWETIEYIPNIGRKVQSISDRVELYLMKHDVFRKKEWLYMNIWRLNYPKSLKNRRLRSVLWNSYIKKIYVIFWHQTEIKNKIFYWWMIHCESMTFWSVFLTNSKNICVELDTENLP